MIIYSQEWKYSTLHLLITSFYIWKFCRINTYIHVYKKENRECVFSDLNTFRKFHFCVSVLWSTYLYNTDSVPKFNIYFLCKMHVLFWWAISPLSLFVNIYSSIFMFKEQKLYDIWTKRGRRISNAYQFYTVQSIFNQFYLNREYISI